MFEGVTETDISARDACGRTTDTIPTRAAVIMTRCDVAIVVLPESRLMSMTTLRDERQCLIAPLAIQSAGCTTHQRCL